MKSYLVTFTSRDGTYHRSHCLAHNIGEACRIALHDETDAPVRLKVVQS